MMEGILQTPAQCASMRGQTRRYLQRGPTRRKFESNVRARCAIRGGEYYLPEPLIIERLNGDETGRFEIAAYGDEEVTFVGYVYLDPSTTQWTWKEGAESGAEPRAGHWYTELDDTIPHPWQLFVDGEMFVNARWPDARWDDKSMFYAKNWAHGSSASTFVDDINSDSTMVEGSGKLASSALNFTGASAILNIKHWFTFSTVVEWHNPGDASFTYRKQPGWKGKKYVASHDLFYLENKAELISQETEWHYDKKDRALRVALRGGKSADLSALKIGVRVQEYAFGCTHSTDVTFKSMGFRGTTVWTATDKFNEPVRGIVYDSLRFEFPSSQKRMLGDHRHSWPTTLYEKAIENGPCYNRIFNCTLTGAEGDPVIYSRGAGMTFDNNKFEWTDYTAITTVPCWPGGGGGIDADGSLKDKAVDDCKPSAKYGGGGTALQGGSGTVDEPAIIRRTTYKNYAASSGISVGKNALVELNEMSHALDIQLDGALIQGGGHDKYETGGTSERWAPPLCPSKKAEGDCSAAGCAWDGSACSGFPSEEYLALPENAPPAASLDGSSWFGARYINNWVHDSLNERTSKRGLRFDRAQDICNGRFDNTWPNRGTMQQNVVWRTAGVMVKGSGINVTRNTIFDSRGGPDGGSLDDEGSKVMDLTMYDEFSEGTCSCSRSYCVQQPGTCCVTLPDGTDVDSTFEGRLNTITGNAFGSAAQRRQGKRPRYR